MAPTISSAANSAHPIKGHGGHGRTGPKSTFARGTARWGTRLDFMGGDAERFPVQGAGGECAVGEGQLALITSTGHSPAGGGSPEVRVSRAVG